MDTQELTRETLYKQVWERPMRQVAADLRISDVALKKICRRMEIPTPWRGYWRRRELGYEPKIPSLPKLSSKGESTVTVQGRLYPKPVEPDGLPGADEIEQRIQAVDAAEYPLIAGLRTSLSAGKANERQILQPRAKRAGFIGVSDGTKSRALDLLNTLLLACDANQIAVSVDTEKSPVLRLQADGEDLGLTISEKVYRKDHVLTEKEKRSKYTWGFPRYDYFPSGVLTLQIHGVLPYGTRTAWSDGKVKHLEDKVGEIVRGIFAVAKAQAAERIAAEQRRIAREEERRRWEEAERLRRQKKQRRVHLEKLAAQWHEAQRLAAFIEAVEADLDALAEVEIHGQPVNEWLIEAKQAVVAANPLRNAAWWDIEKQVPSWEIR